MKLLLLLFLHVLHGAVSEVNRENPIWNRQKLPLQGSEDIHGDIVENLFNFITPQES